MTKTKRNFIFIASLLFIVMALCSVFIIVQTKPRTVEAATLSETELQQRRNNPGLYKTGTTELVVDETSKKKLTWDELINGGKIKITNRKLSVSDKTLAGDLVLKNVAGLTSLNCSFLNCSKLTSIDLNYLDTSKVTDMDCMFAGCSSLTSLDLSNLNTSNVSNDMGGMFQDCSSLISLDLSNFNTSKVVGMEGMFSGCSSLISLDLGIFDTSKVTNMKMMFKDCSKLTSISFNNFNTSNVTDMSWMFYGCTSLTSLDLSSFDTSKVTDMSWLFEKCTSLTSLNLSNFNTSKVTDMSWMFQDCSSLTKLDLSNFNTSNVTDMAYMFENCSSLISLDVSKFNTSKVEYMRWMFSGCSSLTSLDVSSFDTSNVTSMLSMFYGCSKLTSIDVSNFDTSNVTDMDWMFYGCTSLKSLDVSGFNTSKVYTFTAMFGGTKLTVLDMSNFDFSSADSTNLMGMLGINDTYCLGVLEQMASDYVPVYQSAMKNEDISGALGTISPDLANMYSSAIAGKTGDEVGYTGRVYIVGILINQMLHSGDATQMEASLNDAQVLFETKIGTIYAPAKAASKQISLPYGTNYVGSSNGTKTALPAQILYGYEDISSGTPLTELAIFEGTLDTPAPKPSEVVPSTGVQANIAMVVVALVSILCLVVIATKRKGVKKF